MAVHRLNVPYAIADQDALEAAMRELDKAGQKVNFVQYFCVAPQATFLIQTTGGSSVKLADAGTLVEAAAPKAKQRVERRTRS